MPQEDLMARFRQFRDRAVGTDRPARAGTVGGTPPDGARGGKAWSGNDGQAGATAAAWPGREHAPTGPSAGGPDAVDAGLLGWGAESGSGLEPGVRVPRQEEFRLLPGVRDLAGEWPSRLAGVDLGPLVGWRWLDLETTGLHGAGARAFLAAVGRVEGDGVCVRQLLLEDLDREREFVATVLDAFQGATAVVTFNGKAFDWPMLRDRCVACGLTRSWRELPHWDVLFAARRVYGPWLGSCDLGRLSAEVLGEPREGEPSGAVIPMLYQAYLQGDRGALYGVGLRNRRDVCALAGVAARLAGALSGRAEPAGGVRLRFGLAQQFERLGEWERALACYQACADDGPRDASSDVRVEVPGADPPGGGGAWAAARGVLGGGAAGVTKRAATQAAGRLLKRLGRHEEAAALWERSRRGPVPSLDAAVELAKYLEHRRRDPEGALAVVREAMRAAPWMSDERRADLEHRLARLARKTAGGGVGGRPS